MGLLRVTLGAQTFGTSGNHKVVSQDKRLRGEVSTHLINEERQLDCSGASGGAGGGARGGGARSPICRRYIITFFLLSIAKQ